MKRMKLALSVLFPPKTGLIDHIETSTDIITAEQYKDLCKVAAMKNNIGDTFTELRYRFAEFVKLNNDGNKLSLGQSINNMHQCLFNVQNGINISTIGLEALKKKA